MFFIVLECFFKLVITFHVTSLDIIKLAKLNPKRQTNNQCNIGGKEEFTLIFH